MAGRLSQHHRRVATAALLLCFVVATMLVSIELGRRGDGESVDPGPVGEEVRPGFGGVTRNVASLSDWNAAVAAAQPGDVIRLTATINARLAYRGDNAGNAAEGGHGTAQAPIVITANPGVWVDPGNKSNNVGAVDILYVNHVHVVGVNVRNSQFGIRCLQCNGAAGAPIRFANNVLTEIGHAGMQFAGHWGTHAPSTHGLLEYNTITKTGRTAAQYGEGIYLGHGGTEWVDNSSDITVRGNDISQTGAEGIDIKPGTRNVVVSGNRVHDLAPISGGAISVHYVNAIANPHPSQLDQVTVQGNLIWNVNLGGVSGSNDWAIWVGHGGVDIVDNVIWGLRNDWSRARAIRVRATQSFGPHPIKISNNTFWSARGWLAEGSPSGGANVQATGNRGVESGTSEIQVTASAFVGPVPALGASSTADNGGGPGSALTLVGGAPPTTTAPPPPTTASAPPTTGAPASAPTSAPAAAPAPADEGGAGAATPGSIPSGPTDPVGDPSTASPLPTPAAEVPVDPSTGETLDSASGASGQAGTSPTGEGADGVALGVGESPPGSRGGSGDVSSLPPDDLEFADDGSGADGSGSDSDEAIGLRQPIGPGHRLPSTRLGSWVVALLAVLSAALGVRARRRSRVL